MGRRRRRSRHPKKYCSIQYLKCIGYTKQGKGIVNFKGKPFHVDELIEGESAQILVYYEEDDFGTARAIKLKNPSHKRALPLGHWKFSLGSYQIPHLKDEYQDEFKQNQVNALFEQAMPIKVGKRTFYRNKVSLTNGGFMPPGRGRRYSIVPEEFDLMKLDFSKYPQDKVTIVRRLDTEIFGKPGTKIFTHDQMLGKKFQVGLDSFYQVNSQMAKIAYEDILSFIPDQKVIFDLFGGAATIGIIVSDKAKKVYSVEINKDSHQDALTNIKLNNIKNVEAILGDANDFVIKSKVRPEVIIVDPARAGLPSESVAAINKSKAELVIYLSCNIETQARDVKALDNYKIIHVQPYDFFPQTYHIENLVVMKLK